MGGHTSRLHFEPRRPGTSARKPVFKYDGLLFQDQQYLGRGKLEITKEEIIFHRKSRETLVWPIRGVRRFGCENDAFSFESGRCCVSGPGFYTFQAKQASRILSSVQETAGQVAAADRLARAEIPSRLNAVISRPPNFRPLPAQPGKEEGNLYINCDSAGRVIDWDLVDGQPKDTRPQNKKVETQGIHYADLDLSALKKLPPSPKSSWVEKSKDPINLVSRIPRIEAVIYAKIDSTKSLAAAKLARSRS